LCFITAGISVLLRTHDHNPLFKSISTILTSVFGAIAILSLSQNVFHWSAGIDQLVVTDYNSIKQHLPFPGRISAPASLCFSLLALSFLGIRSKRNSYKLIAQYLLHVITLTSFIAIIGYLFNVLYTLNFSFFSSIAFSTAIGLFTLSIAAATVNGELGLSALFTGKQAGNIIARRLFPSMVVILLLLGYISLEMQRNNYISSEFGMVLSTVIFLLIGLFLIRNTVSEINRQDIKRTEAEAETQLLNKNLEGMVRQRTLELEQSNDRVLKIFNANPICIAITNIETGKYVDINPALLDLLGYTADEVIGKTASGLGIISAEYRQKMVDTLSHHGCMRNVDTVLKSKTGEDKHVLLSAEALETVDGKFMMSFVYDITNRKLMENELQESKSSLEVLTDKLTNQNKQLLSFAHIISHNLRSPVSNLNLLLHLYKESTTAEDKDELWQNFETVIGHLNTSLDDLLETLRIQEDTTKERETLSFENIYKPVHDVLIGQIMQGSVIIHTDFSKAEHVVYPKMYLESIMLNLVSNAIKYKSPDRRPEISIKTDSIDGQIILTVQDNGLGIDLKRHQKNLFGLRKTFHRHAEAKGLGLFITKTQIEAMGGEITAESEVGVGTMFKVIFNKK
jgi:PAS domain S-box-containing protein